MPSGVALAVSRGCSSTVWALPPQSLGAACVLSRRCPCVAWAGALVGLVLVGHKIKNKKKNFFFDVFSLKTCLLLEDWQKLRMLFKGVVVVSLGKRLLRWAPPSVGHSAQRLWTLSTHHRPTCLVHHLPSFSPAVNDALDSSLYYRLGGALSRKIYTILFPLWCTFGGEMKPLSDIVGGGKIV